MKQRQQQILPSDGAKQGVVVVIADNLRIGDEENPEMIDKWRLEQFSYP